jgi:exodeoxyribonuclease-3
MVSFKIATWNVNSLRVRLPHVLQWLSDYQPDVLALQEIKLPDDDFPIEAIRQAGYYVYYSGQKTYNGVALLSRSPCTDLVKDIPGLDDPQRRVLAGTIQGMRILNLYVPNGESIESEKYAYKLNWLHHLKLFVAEEIKKYPKLILLGDFNIAPTPLDVHDPILWEGKVLFSEKERAALQDIMNLGLIDSFRLHAQPEKSFSWWDYRLNAFKRNMGLRIDHIFINKALSSHCKHCYIDKLPRALERPSDHAPVVGEFDI